MNGMTWKNIRMHGLSSKVAQELANTTNQPNHRCCLLLLQGHSANNAFKAGGDHDKQCRNCIGNISPCFYKDAISVLTKAAHNLQEEYPYLKNVQLWKYMYDEYFNREYTSLYKLTGLMKLPCLLLPWCFEAAVKEHFWTKPTKDSSGLKPIQNEW